MLIYVNFANIPLKVFHWKFLTIFWENVDVVNSVTSILEGKDVLIANLNIYISTLSAFHSFDCLLKAWNPPKTFEDILERKVKQANR